MQIIDVNPGDRIMFIAGEGMNDKDIATMVNGMTTAHRIAVVNPEDVDTAFVIRADPSLVRFDTSHDFGHDPISMEAHRAPVLRSDGQETVPISDLLTGGGTLVRTDTE